MHELLNAFLILLGILSAGLGLKGFLLPSGFIDGGVTGVSLLLAGVTSLPLAFWLPVINGPFVILGHRYLGARVCHPQRAGDLRARRRPRARALPDSDAGSPARRRIRRILSRRGHRPRRARRGGARWHRDRGSFDQQAQHGAAGWRLHPRVQRRPVRRRDGGARCRGGALFHPYVSDRGANARLRDPRHRGIHGHDDRVGEERGDSRRHYRHPGPRRDRLSRAGRADQRRAGHPLLRRHAARNRQDQSDCSRHRLGAHSSCRTRSRTSKAGSSKRRRSTWTRKGAARATPRGRAFQSGCRAPAT